MEKESKKKSVGKSKKTLTIILGLVLLGIIIFFAYSGYTYFKSPEKQIGIGAEIESVVISEDGQTAFVKLKAGSNIEDITGVKFVFKDDAGNEYVYETSEGAKELSVPFEISFWDKLLGTTPEFEGGAYYSISIDDVEGLDSFNDVEEVGSILKLETEEGEEVESPVLDTKKPTPVSTSDGDSSGEDYTPPGTTPSCGDGNCDAGEDCENCEGDCGVCEEEPFECLPENNCFYVDEDYVLTINDLTSGITGNFTLINPPDHGSVSNLTSLTNVNSVNVSYDSSLNYNGEDYFEYNVSEGVSSEVVRVDIIINPVNDAPNMVLGRVNKDIILTVKTTPESVSHLIPAKDIDSDIIYSSPDLPSMLTVDSQTGILRGIISSSDIGVYSVTLNASDGEFEDVDTINIIIRDEKTFYVDNYSSVALCSDENPGTYDQPWCNLEKVLTELAEKNIWAGDTVIFRDGDYGDFNRIGVALWADGAFQVNGWDIYYGDMNTKLPEDVKWITFKAEEDHTPKLTKIDMGDTQGPYKIGYIFDGFIVNRSSPGDVVRFYRGVGLKIFNSKLIGNFEYEGSSTPAVIYTAGSEDLQIINNSLSKNRYGFYPGGNNIDFIGNEITDIGEDPMRLGGNNLLVENNKLHSFGPNVPATAHQDYIHFISMENATFRNNRIYAHAGSCHFNGAGHTFRNFVFENNILYDLGTELPVGTVIDAVFRNNTLIGLGASPGFSMSSSASNVNISNNLFLTLYGGDESSMDYHDHNIYVSILDWSPGVNEPNSYGIQTDGVNKYRDIQNILGETLTNYPEYCHSIIYNKRYFENLILGEDAEGYVTISNVGETFDEFNLRKHFDYIEFDKVPELSCNSWADSCRIRFKKIEPGLLTIYQQYDDFVFGSIVFNGALGYSASNKNKIYVADTFGHSIVDTYHVGDVIEYHYDGVGREIIAISEDEHGNYTQFTPDLPEDAEVDRWFCNWGQGATNIVRDFRPKMGSAACNGTVNSPGVAVGLFPCAPECSGIESKGCYTGPDETKGIGICYEGTQTCIDPPGMFSTCQGEQTPIGEICGNGIDENCDGIDPNCPPIVPEGYVSWWRFDGGTDDLAQKNDGVFVGTSENYIERLAGDNALEFNGDADYVKVSSNISLRMNETLTISAWIKVNTLTPENDMYIVSKTDRTPDDDNYRFFVGGGNKAANGNLGFGYYGDGVTSFWQNKDSGYILPDLNWHYVTVVFDFNNGVLDFYYDGFNVSRKIIAVPLDVANDRNLYIGVDGGSVSFFNGSIDEVMIYNRALNITEIEEIYCVQGEGTEEFCGEYLSSLSPFTTLLNWIKGILTHKTGKAILEGKITGNVIGDGSKNDNIFIGVIGFSLIIVLIIIILIIVKIKKKMI